MDDLYTETIKRHIYEAKSRIPADFQITTVEREIYGSDMPDTIIIQIDSKMFDWRTVEDRLSIALVLEKLKELIGKEGIPCLIEKVK